MAAPMASARLALTGLKNAQNARNFRLIQCHLMGRRCLSPPLACCISQITRYLCSGHSDDGGKNVTPKDTPIKRDSAATKEKPGIKIELAKPKGKKKAASKSDQETKSSSSSDSSTSSDSSDSSDDEGQHGQVKPEMITATKAVAQALGGNARRTESDILSQLKKHQKLTEAQRKGAAPQSATDTTNSLKDIFSGMKVEHEEPRQISLKGKDRKKHTFFDKKRAGKPAQKDRSSVPDVKLYEGSALGIFTAKQTATSEVARTDDQEDIFTMIEKEELAKTCTFPAPNAFEEMIQMSLEGKIWKFPIDNEYGLDEEAKVGFHEHVFLEHLLCHFPEKGPVRVFMDLVLVGLSKNPYLTVQQKHEHVIWFKNYFDEKRHILEELMRSGEEESQKEIQ